METPTWKTLLPDDLTPRLPDLVASCGWEDATMIDQATGKRHVENADELSDSGERDAPREKRGKRQKQQPQRKRRTTYEIRKQQKSDLVTQVKMMQTQLDELKYRVLVEQGETAKSHERTTAANSVLQECIQGQHVGLADMQAMLASHIQDNLHTLQPAQTVIQLGTDRVERHKTLMAMKDRKLREGKRFITARSRGLDPRASYSQEERYETPGDDFCVMRFDNSPIYGSSVKAVFDAIIHSVLHSEIIISELFGSITIREDNDFDDSNVSQLRLVSSTSRGAMVESNSVMFSEFSDGTDGKECSYGIVAADFVDSDELYPYRPTERVRRDTTTVVLIRSLTELDSQTRTSNDGNCSEDQTDSNKAEDAQTVVATRWTCSKMPHTELDIPRGRLQELQESSVCWGDTMKNCIQQHLGKAAL
ncbi:hypothetical protein BBJ28_00006764 [Nothophytophthora sp. Chile5]|nr:hypothetical protein BBJ28_00006764 [Nothophytophthora sp. Chile5]